MRDPLIFWQQPLRVRGPRGVGDAAGTVLSLINVAGITLGERLMGSLDGERVRAWRATPMSKAGDVVEFHGILRADGDGSAIEGSVAYNLRTKIQFVGCLALGLFIAGTGAVHWLQDLPQGRELAAVGAFVTGATLLWIYSSRKLAWKQIAFIEHELGRAVGKT